MTYLLQFLICLISIVSYASISPVSLTCEYQKNPLGIDVLKPRLSWVVSSGEQNQKQSSYEIIVGTSLAEVSAFQGSAWSTGKINSPESIQVEYAGSGLRPFVRYYWRVRIYDQDGNASAWSEAAWFETAMLTPTDWQASWIGDGSKQFEKDEDFYQDDRMPLFRKSFSTKKVSQARLYISGLGYYEAFLNGKKISDNMLDPGWTTYRKEVLYVTHDITTIVKTGDNILSVTLGNGWYNPLPIRLFSRFNLRNTQETGRPRMKAELHLTYADGSKEKVLTDESWLCAPGPVVRNNVYLGEKYDARLEQPDWLSGKANTLQWKNAAIVDAPSGRLRAQMLPPIRVTRVLKPLSLKELKPGVFIVDMGQNFAGVARIKVKGPAGTVVKLKYGEALHADGTLNYLTTVAGQIKEIWNLKGGPGAPATAWQEDTYILKDGDIEVWSPRFTFHGFRYVEIVGWPGKPDVNSIEGLRMNSDLQSVGEFSCSNEMFNQLHEATRWTFLSNVFSVQSDCPGREKMGYGADIVVTANSFLYNFNMGNFYSKTVSDYANEQQPDGGITEIAPYTGIADQGYGGESGPLGWQLAFPYVQKQLCQFYGDKRIIGENYEGLKKQIDFLKAKAVSGLFHWDISDHVALDPKPEAFSASAFYYHHVLLAQEFAGILGNKTDEENFKKLAEQIKSRIVAKYLVKTTGRFDNATQSAQLFALWYNLSPEPDKTFEVLKAEFERHNNHVSSGIFGVMMMFDVLRELNQNELAYRVANQRDYPGWGYMFSKGATTLWESWEYPDNAPSQNHPMFGSTEEWFYRTLLGINPGGPGFSKITIKPQPAGDLTWAKGSYQSIRGEVKSEWKLTGGKKFTLQVHVPANTTAQIWVKRKGNGIILESNKPIAPTRFEDGYAVVEVGSGQYVFETEWK